MAFKQQGKSSSPAPVVPRDIPDKPMLPANIFDKNAMEVHRQADAAWWQNMKQHLNELEARIAALSK
jgi:hypothetical protein